MLDNLAPGYERRSFLVILSLAVLVALVARYVLIPIVSGNPLPAWDEVAIGAVDSLIATGIAAIGISLLFFWLRPARVRAAEVEVVHPNQIRHELRKARQDTTEWWFSGACGRYTCSVTLPELARQARSRNRTTSIRLLILDPADKEVCEQYANYRNKVRTGSGSPWTAQQVKLECLATIVTAYCWKTEVALLEVSVYLRPRLSTFRYDLSSTAVLVTTEDPFDPAMKCAAGTHYYNVHFEDLRLQRAQARGLSDQVQGPRFSELTVQGLPQLLQAIGVQVPLTDTECEQVIDLARKRDNVYA